MRGNRSPKMHTSRKVDMAKRSLLNPRPSTIIDIPTAVRRYGWKSKRCASCSSTLLHARVRDDWSTGHHGPEQSWCLTPRLARQVKRSEGSLHRPDKLLCEQRRNQPQLPTWVSGQDANAGGWGSEAVVVDGVTTVQGARESRAQGEGPQESEPIDTGRQKGRAALGRIRRQTSSL